MYDDAGSLGDMGEEKDEKGLIKYSSTAPARLSDAPTFPALLHPERRLQRMFCADGIHNFGRATWWVTLPACRYIWNRRDSDQAPYIESNPMFIFRLNLWCFPFGLEGGQQHNHPFHTQEGWAELNGCHRWGRLQPLELGGGGG